MADSNDFVHLHTHSEYSLLDGLGRVKKLVAEAKRLGQPALALTDHGAMHGAIEFFRACRDAGIQPIIGLEAYQTLWGRPMTGREHQLDRENYHLLLLAKDMTGYRNLLKICSQSHLRGYYYRPRVDHDFLAAHAKGLICTTGCLGAEVPQLLMQGKEEEAYQRLGWYVDVFGKENFFIELQEHSIPELVEVNKVLIPWAKKFGLQLVVTNDVHYVREEDGGPHDILLCVQTGASVDAPDRMRMSDGSYFLKSRAQMEETFRPLLDLEDPFGRSAFDNTRLVAEMCQVDLEDPNYHLPDLPIPEGFTYETYLRHLTEKGLRERYGDRADDPEVQERKERELRIIHEMGFDVYFLIVADLCNFARSRNIWWNVRGSGAGSLVAYCIGITGIDPLKNNLIFERFLNPGRVTMPDFDLDFPDDQREEMIRYTVEKYGEDQVAQIVTFGRMKARAAIRDVGRAKGIELKQVDRIAKLIPAIPGKPVTIQDVLTEGHEFYNPELVELYQQHEWVRDLLDTSMKLEGVARHSSVHAAAVIVADRELTHYTPLMRGNKNTITSTITQYEFPILESIGLLKVDFLGLSTLSVMREAARLIKERHGVEYNLSTIPFEGPEAEDAFKLLSSGEVSGVFQVESQGMRRVLTEMRPTSFEHIVATISLYRPGPLEYIPQFIRRLHGEEQVEYKHPALEPILSETYGICVSGDALITEARTGRRYRLADIGQLQEFHVQGVDANWRPAIGRVTHWIDSGEKPVYRITLRNGASTKVTEDHRLLTEFGWRPLRDLRPGDYVAVPPSLFGPQETVQPVDRRRLRVLAYLLGDGSLASAACVDFVSKDPALLAEYERCLEAFEGVRPHFTKQVRGVIRIGASKKAGAGDYHTPNVLLAWLRELGLKAPAGQRPGGVRSHEKFIPDFVFGLGTEDLAFFLASLWDCDGYVSHKLCHYRTVSPRLAEQVQTLLLRLGIQSAIYQSQYAVGRGTQQRTSYQVTVYDTARFAALLQPHMVSAKRDVACNQQRSPTLARQPFLEEVDAVRTLSYRGLMEAYGVSRQHFYPKGRARERISARVAGSLADVMPLPETRRRLNLAWEEVVSIEFVGVEHVYDLTVEGLHSFVADNIVVHNCVYQEQIIQILSQLAGYTPGEADLVRRAISKKKASDIEKHKKIFAEGCARNGIPKEVAHAIYADIEYFARYGFNKCLPGDAEIVDAASGRLVRVADLYAGTVQLAETVTCDVAHLTLRPGRVSAVMDNGVKPVYRLTTRLGKRLEATANHPFYTLEGWRHLEELKPGDRIAVPRRLPVEGRQEWPDHEVIVLGHLLAEGNLCHPHSVYFYSQDWEQVEDYVQAAEQFDNVQCTVSRHRETFSVYARRIDRRQEPGIVPWARKLRIWGRNARDKEIPGAVFELTNRQIGLLLSRMWEGDGHINVHGRSLYYATASERLARQMQHLLLRFGIISRLRTVQFPYKEGRVGYQLFITGHDNIQIFAERIGCFFVSRERQAMLEQLLLKAPLANGTSMVWRKYHGRNSAAMSLVEPINEFLPGFTKDIVPLGVKALVRAAKERTGITWAQVKADCGVAQREFYPTNAPTKQGFTRQTIQRLADYFDDDALRRYADNDIYWDEIESIEYVGEKQTYDLEVPGTHNFIANDILVHNSHAADYAVITVQTAFLKARYPVEYMAALLLVERDKTEKVVNFINECRRMGIDVLPPDVNYSGLDFEIQELPADTPTMAHRDPQLGYDFPVPPGSAIRFGMAAVKNVGEGPVKAIIEAREEGGPFTSLEDFCDRVDLRQVNRRALECLIKVGAFDRFGKRTQLLAVIDEMVARSASTHQARESGQLSMFDLLEDVNAAEVSPIRLPDIEEAKGRERLQWEKELLGVYAMSHPLQHLEVDLRNLVTCGCNELDARYDGKNVMLAGMIAGVRTITTKKGDPMAFVQLEDLQGQCEVVVFPRTYAEVKELLIPDNVVVVKGKAQTREGQTSLLADSIQTYIDRPVVKDEDESSRYQKPLLDVAPTINGMAVAEEELEYMDAYTDDDLPLAEESPFRDVPPAWINAAAPADAETADSEAHAATSSPAESQEPTAAPALAVVETAQASAAPPEPSPTAGPGRDRPSEESATRRAVPGEEPAANQPDGYADRAAPSNGHGRGNGHKAHQDDPAPDNGEDEAQGVEKRKGTRRGSQRAARASLEPRVLEITFRCSGNLERDKYRLKEIHETTRDPRGRDRFFIVLKSNGHARKLAFPNDPCTISDRLLHELTKRFRLEVTVTDSAP
ncbi:DNA polymerase III subunit alpha [Litorilinea aerophila]|uniref:DNA polymerase III subunit alpha n=1 Tax=Litorilinea aerophila TaxID=1204385 RepID=A0A540VAD6_9CHLR|nr:DNA polymerase III subunit alpha [Litorilinea aerophila]MCC9078438.1 DNA polymerase III subunit alpha [Litorilinea aerophila]